MPQGNGVVTQFNAQSERGLKRLWSVHSLDLWRVSLQGGGDIIGYRTLLFVCLLTLYSYAHTMG